MDKLIEQFEHLKVTAAARDLDEDPSIKELIETYSKAVLDCTFFHENYLTENDFRLDTAEEDISTTLHLLDAIVALCASVDKSGRDPNEITSLSQISPCPSSIFKAKTDSGDSYQSVVNVLGIDFGECVLWRQGSLLYAFCSAKLSSDPGWVEDNQDRLLNYLREGINYFHLMLSLRRNLISPSLYEDRDTSSHYSYGDIDSSSHGTSSREDHHITFTSAKDYNLSNINELGKLLVQKKQIIGALGQELDELQKSLEEQQSLNQATQEKIEHQIDRNPDLRHELEQALAEVSAKQEEVREQQEKNVEKKHQIEDCLRQLQKQQDELDPGPYRQAANNSHIAESSSVNTFELLDMGVMSDTHMFAMMYCGDMAFWYCKYSRDWNLIDPTNRYVFNEIRHIGISYLRIYIKGVDRVLKFSGWNCERAKELLKYFNELR